MSKRIISFLTILVVGVVIIAYFTGYHKKGCSLFYRLNPDMVCRVHDELGDRSLIEYFNLDTNDLRLVVQTNGVDMVVEHPNGKVEKYLPDVQSNQLLFDRSNPNSIIVNGEVFPIIPKTP